MQDPSQHGLYAYEDPDGDHYADITFDQIFNSHNASSDQNHTTYRSDDHDQSINDKIPAFFDGLRASCVT